MNTITIIQHNVNHWRNKKYELSNVYRNLDPDIILINDTGLPEGEKLTIPYFDTFQSNKQGIQHRGTALAIRSTLKYTLHDDFETDILAVTIETRQGPITIATDYLAPNTEYINYVDWNYLLNRRYPVYIVGDLNARHSLLGHSDSNPVGRGLATLIRHNKLKHIGPAFPTLLRSNSTTKPDIVLSNMMAYHNVHLDAGPLTTSDHIPIIMKITGNPIQIPIKPRFQFNKGNWDAYKAELSDIIPPNLNGISSHEIDQHLEAWTKKVQDATKKSVPVLTHRIIPGVKPTPEIIQMQHRYRAILNHIQEAGISPQIMRRITDARLRIRNAYLTLRDRTWEEIIQKIKIDEKDGSKFWKSIKRMMGNKKQAIPYIRDSHNNKLHTPEEKEEAFRNHWKHIFRNDLEDEDFDENNIDLVEGYIGAHEGDLTPYQLSDDSRLESLQCPSISLEEVKQTIKRFKQRAPGPNKITAIQLKKLPENMLQYFVNILNACLSSGYFPDTMKHAVMIFLPKGTSSQYQVQNYRPISLLNVEGKVFDKILNDRFTNYTEIHRLTNSRQHGFRRGRGTHTALASLYENIANKLANKSTTDVVLRDVQKAFDKVWHDGLRYKILQSGIHPCYTKVLSSFLHNRHASISIGSHLGPPFRLRSGVPQGACLSPTLYGFFTHDIGEPPTHCDYIAYADDITQITSFKHSHRYAARLTARAIEHINTFEKKWKIKTNLRKFEIINMSRRNTTPIQIDNESFAYTRKGTVLGLDISTHGISHQTKKRKMIASRNLDSILRFRNLSSSCKIKLYKSLVQSALTYPTVPLNASYKTGFIDLQRVQNRALRFITGTRWNDFRTSESLHQECNILPINQTIHKQAKKTWEHIKDYFPDTYERLVAETSIYPYHARWPSSRKQAEGPTPLPLFK